MWYQPVKVRSRISKEEFRTKPMLDNSSQGSFVKKPLLKELKVEGKSTTVTVKTLNENCKHSSLAVNNMEVANRKRKTG